MKVVQINAVYGVGSTGRIAQQLHNALEKNGDKAYVFYGVKSSENNNDKIKRIGNTMEHKAHALLWRIDGKQGFHSALSTKQLCLEIERIQPDVVHLHNLHSNYVHLEILLGFLAKAKIPVMITLHDCWFFTGGCTHYLRYGNCEQWKNGCQNCPMKDSQGRVAKTLYAKKENLYKALPILAFNGVSKWTTRAGQDSILSVAKLYKTIYNWTDTAVFKPSENVEELRKKYGIADGEQVILGVSQGWGKGKGLQEFQFLAKAFNDNVKVLLVGEYGNLKDENNLQFLGTKTQKELVELYSIADVFVNPSRMETFGLVTTEAMSCGTPVVAYDNTGSAELVTSACGRLVKDGDVQALKESVQLVLNDGKAKYSQACRAWVQENFEKEKQIAEYLRFYEEIKS